MCILCVEIAQGRLKAYEARRNLGEMVDQLDGQHQREVEEKIQVLEAQEKEESDHSP